MKRQTSFGAATLLALAVCVLGACTGGTDSLRPLTDGDPAPAWGGVTLSGDSVGAHVGDTPLLVNVWATWCVPCREEMPALQQVHEETEGRLRIVAVSIVGSGAGADIRHFLDDYGITFPIVHDPSERVTRAFRTTGVPESFLISDGRVAKRWRGPLTLEGARAALAALE
jgi:thiol-disulfide isomerase/thioredoxin